MSGIKKIFILLLFFSEVILSQGKIYFVLGSDTGIWQGMGLKTFNNYYGDYLYVEEGENAELVMDPSFRDKIRDSQGNPLKLTWWMHGGNIFRYGSNQNVPHPNYLPLYLMNKYHGESIKDLGDELTLHYHTWVYKDYDKDGIYYWNQAHNFTECRDDFDYTLAQYLLEEEVFPVSFRSGWHYMDNEWQNYLDTLLPFSMHNDYPSKRMTVEEPTGNIYDWSQATSEFVPFHPSSENYQLEGDLNGWNVRSKYFKSVSLEMLDRIFSEASSGKDQVACFWSHLPEDDFLQQIEDLHSRIKQKSSEYPEVEFYYMTAVEAMQAWLKTSDTTAPEISFQKNVSGEEVTFSVTSNENIFQPQPFVAVKTIFNEYKILNCNSTGENAWETFPPMKVENLVKAGVAVTDTAGNLSHKIIHFIPDDIIVDNKDNEFNLLTFNFIPSDNHAWGNNSLVAELEKNDSAAVQFDIQIDESRYYNFFIQTVPVSNPADSIEVEISENNSPIYSKKIVGDFESKQWKYLTSANLSPGNTSVILKAKNGEDVIKHFSPDVLKATAIVPMRQLTAAPEVLSFGEVSVYDTVYQTLKLENLGRENLTVTSMELGNHKFKFNAEFPLVINPQTGIELEFSFTSSETESVKDTLIINSDDQIYPVRKIPVLANANQYFDVIDNEDVSGYTEYGDWRFSVVNAYGSTSRYSFLTNLNVYAEFETKLLMDGIYSIQELIPETVNSTDNALYIISSSGNVLDSVYADQNEGSGNWKEISRQTFYRNAPVKVTVKNAGGFTKGDVIRADAIKFQLLEEVSDVKNGQTDLPESFTLYQNYPNPFNPATKIKYSIPAGFNNVFVELKIYDLLGREIAMLVNENQSAGVHEISFNAANFSSGVYFYRLKAGSFIETKRMMLLK